MSDTVTIAIPFHRGGPFLRAAIDSVIAQDDDAWKLIVVDDSGGGSDAGEAVAASGDPRIRLHRNPANLGMVANWNRCLDLAASELVTLLHADDRLEPAYVGGMRALASRHPDAAAFFCGARIIDAGGRPRFSFADAIKRIFVPRADRDIVLRGRVAVRALMRGNFIMCPTLCYRLRVLDGERFSQDWQQVQDLEFTTRLLMAGHVLVGETDQAYVYRRHADSATRAQSDNLLRFDEEFRLFDLVAARADALGWDDVARVSRRKAILRLHLGYQILADIASRAPDKARAKLRFLLGHR